MNLKNILSSELPEIDNSIKECVNQGQWLLFKSKTIVSSEAKTSLYLKVGTSVYALSDRGRVIKEVEKPNANFRIDEMFYFSDIPKPQSLSNAPLSHMSSVA
jgi:hypothetical protein